MNSNAWSKSRLWNGPATRCEQILDRMISLSKERPELRPDTTSFNTIIDTLAKSKESNREQRAELLLEKMQELSSSENGLNCRPDQMVRSRFNFHTRRPFSNYSHFFLAESVIQCGDKLLGTKWNEGGSSPGNSDSEAHGDEIRRRDF